MQWTTICLTNFPLLAGDNFYPKLLKPLIGQDLRKKIISYFMFKQCRTKENGLEELIGNHYFWLDFIGYLMG